MKSKTYFIHILLVIICSHLISCEDFVEVEAPNHKLVNDLVFNNDETALSAMQGIYNELFRVSDFSNGGNNSITALAGLTAREIVNYDPTNLVYVEFEENEILPNNPANLDLWNSAYNTIYQVNSLLEGLENSDQITEDVYRHLKGQAQFVRAFTYFYLVNLYSEVPLILSSDYRVNIAAAQNPENEIYDRIISDLEESIGLLGMDYQEGDRTYVNKYGAMALLARVYLYRQNWGQAEYYSSQVISASDFYSLLQDLDQVFLKNSPEAIWQISPAGRGNAVSTYTNEAYLFISSFPVFTLSDATLNSFDQEDLRFASWIGYSTERDSYYPYKYKDGSSFDNITEYSMVLRLAEQYLIRAEARSQQNNLTAAINDLDKVRERSNLYLIAEDNPTISKEELLYLILTERQKELFTEWGHRWFDLKRTGRASEVLGTNNPQWEETDELFPIPEAERIKNPNLGQSPGY